MKKIRKMKKPQLIDLLHHAVDSDKLHKAKELITALHPSEAADLLGGLPGKLRQTVWQLLDSDNTGKVLPYIQETVRAELLDQMQPQEVLEITRSLDADDAVDILQELPSDIASTVLNAMGEQNRQRLSSILSYPENVAGGMMNTDVVSVRVDVSLDVVSRYLRKMHAIPEKTDSLMVVDRSNCYKGVLPLTAILVLEPTITVGEAMTEAVSIDANLHEDEVATLFEQRDLVSAAVVDEQNRLLGRITIDDVVDVIQENAEYTVRRMAGLGDDDLFAPVIASAKRRAVWLGVNLLTTFLAVWVIDLFEDTIQQLIALAILMPLVSGMGGIAGNQTLIITIRGAALGYIAKTNIRPLLLKEIAVSLINGLLWSTIVAVIVILWFDVFFLGVIIAAAMIINLLIAALAGASIPLILRRYGIDPAIAGSVILTTITDVVGFASFLGLAALLL